MNRFFHCFAASLALIPTANASNTWYVDINAASPGNGSQLSPYTSIQYAINQPTTVSMDTLLVAPGEYLENVSTFTGISYKSLLIESMGGPGITAIRAPLGNIVEVFSGSEIRGFTVSGVNGSLLTTGVSACGGIVRRCVLTGNGVGLYACIDTSLFESTVSGNYTGVDVSVFDTIHIRNSIDRGNTHTSSFGGVVFASYSVFDINVPGAGNMNASPGFWQATAGDWHLKPGSICIDAGDPASPFDSDGTRIDIGAYTYDSTYAPAPTSYCSGKLNSQGCVPSIGAIGTASASSGAPFAITATNEVDHKVGLLLTGFDRLAQPFQGGVLCIQSPIKRLGAQNSGGSGACTGNYAFDMAAYIQSGVNPGLVPGAIVDCQWWSRDPLDPAGFGCGLSNALAFGIAP